MADTDVAAKKKPLSDMRLIQIASADNPKLLMAALTYPQAASGLISFDQTRPHTTLQPFTWWTLVPVNADRTIFQIFFFPSDGNLCLAASANTSGASLELSAVDPSNLLQLWQLNETKPGAQLITCHGQTTMQMGFPHDIPLKTMKLQLSPVPDTHETGDKFIIKDVTL
ncbi:MAG: hypothetical protein ABJP48_02535 [Erythrobacter sp.]